ncbi:MAG: hypothetical protein ABIE94_02945 [archaeon]
MKKYAWVLFLIVALLILTSCETVPEDNLDESSDDVEDVPVDEPIEGEPEEIVCEPPYMRHGADCCIDQDSNKVCDKDEIPEEEPVSEEEVLEQVAKKFGRAREMSDYEELYDLLTPERQSYKTKQEFVTLFPYVAFGRRQVYDSEGDLIKSNSTYPNYVSSMKLDEVEVDGEEGFAYYDITYNNGWDQSSGTYYFKKVEGEWRFDGYSNVVYAGCFKDEDCYEKPDKLQADCEKTCTEEKGAPLREENQFVCYKEVCHCQCWDEAAAKGYRVMPAWKTIH